ncbi:uncharacterized protein si:dkey-93h22.7 isoform X3 [Salvelinus fontinalis]|uniref:uncharacterized protein si:dkey-93h22.7 isoform X3 n=2 Tax=Salvelinus fontinalis TaxID=8038 RepID=UPI00248524E2|nr:uncharacterized protein si:dkey-93h22.7 isoform X3 [Salvelinus fontinalis]
MTTLRTTVVVLLGFYTFCQETRTSVLGASVPGTSVPGTSVPGASVPGTSVPGTSVPGASVPGTSVPGTSVPGASVPGTSVPRASVPGTSVPGASVPGTPVPGASVPGTPVPGTPVPGTSVPGASVPGTSVPGTSVPGASVPRASVPGTSVPGTSVPGTPVPGAPVPGAPVPGASVPGASVPGASVPGASVPGASVPGASVPGASVPGASVPGGSVSGASVLGKPLLYGPSTALEKSVEEFQCEVLHYPKEESILYQLFREGDRSKTLGFYSALSGEMANFPLFITASYEGHMVCVASVQNNTVIQPTVSQRHHLRVVVPVNGAEVVVQSGSLEFYEGKPLSLRCNITKGNHVSYQWLVDGKPLPLSPLHNQTQEQLFIYRMMLEDSGEYTCVATNQLNLTEVYSSRSTAKVIKVKELVSEPDLHILVLKETDGTYIALVTCQSLNGTPPITFSLYSRSEFISTETVDERFATFSIPVVLDLHMGFLQCQAENGDRVMYGQWKAMHIVPVGGAVTMHYDTDVGENFSIVGLTFYCSVERGTFPQYRWFLNGTVLEGRGDFYWVQNQPGQSILLLSVGRSSAGTYHCDVSDSFDGTTVISSEERYIDKEVLNHLPTVVVAVVFGCFLFLVTLVTTCCFIGLLYGKRQYLVETSTLDLKLGLEMHNIMVSDDDEEFLCRPCIMVAEDDNQVLMKRNTWRMRE